MKLDIGGNRKNPIYYLARSQRIDGKVRTIRIKTIGKHNELLAQGHGDPLAHAKEAVRRENERLKADNVLSFGKTVDFSEELEKTGSVDSKSTAKNVGYSYLNEVFNRLGIGEFLKGEASKLRIRYDLADVLRLLAFSRILSPKSKLSTFDDMGSYLADFDLGLDDVYRGMDVLHALSDPLQAHLYKASEKIQHRKKSVLYYDCTNYFFEIEEEDGDAADGSPAGGGLRKYGASKEHRPNPIVQMGLFIDEDGLPLAMSVNPGNTNEQKTATPLEKRIMRDYRLSRFVYCADAGLGSSSIRRFNSLGDRAYIVTQSLKKLSGKDSELVFRNLNWKYLSDGSDADFSRYKSVCEKAASGAGLTDGEKAVVEKGDVYKDYVSEKGERIIVTFSPKAFAYQRGIFLKQLARAKKMAAGGRMAFGPNDVRRFVFSYAIDGDGEMLENEGLGLDGPKADAEREYHGFYAVATNLEDDVREILRINGFRWKIEDSFRVMKTNFKARPVYHQKSERIQAHFLVCFVSLLIFGLLKLKLGSKEITDGALIGTLRNMSVKIDDKIGYGEALYTHSKTLEELEKAYPLGLNRKYYSSAQLRKISKMKS